MNNNYAINLLPPHLRRITGFDTRYMVAGALVGVVLAGGGLFGWHHYKEQQAKREFSRLTGELRQLQSSMQLVRANKALEAQIDGRKDILARLTRERSVKWADVIRQLGAAVPDNLWLIQLSGDADGVINIRGGADDIDTVSEYADNLRQIPDIAHVSLVNLAQSGIQEQKDNSPAQGPEGPGLGVVIYELSVRLKGDHGNEIKS